VTAEDGFVYWWPEGLGGFVAAHNLRKLADELDKRNAVWNKNINDYFDNLPPDNDAKGVIF